MVKKAIGFVAVLLSFSLIFFAPIYSNPNLNSGPGCGASGCHTFQAGILSAVPLGNLQVRITLSGASGNVAGELVDGAGVVRAVNNQTSSNPFTLTAPSEGFYKVNAGFRNPSPRRWDSVTVNILTTGVGHDLGMPGEFRLDQNYPNPFNPTTTIEFALPFTQRTTLKVFDVQGREMATLVDQQLEAGTHAVRWDAGILPSGVYFYRLQAGTSVQTKKLLLMR